MEGYMDIRNVALSVFAIVSVVTLTFIPGSEALQCYNCRGITNYDPNECFVPVAGKTVLQECQKGEVCEKRVTMVDRLQDVVDRGCSNNCNGRTFVWTDEFQVYCCSDTDNCNHASINRLTNWTLLLLSLISVFIYTVMFQNR